MDGLNENQAALPDVKKMRDLQGHISRLYSVDSASLLPSVRQRLGDLVGLVRDTDVLMADHVLRGLIILNNQQWEDLPSPSAEAVSAEQVEIAKELEDDLLRVTARLDTLALNIKSKLERMADFVLPDVEPRVGVLTHERDKQQQLVDTQAKQLERQQQSKADLDEAIHAFQTPSISQVLRGMIPSEEEALVIIKQFSGSALELDLFKLGMKKLNANLDIIGEGQTFVDLIKARDALLLAIDGQRMLQASHEQALQKIEQEIAQLPGIAKVLDWRDQWLVQATIVQQGWARRLDVAKQASELRSLAAALATLRDYLAGVRRLYEKA